LLEKQHSSDDEMEFLGKFVETRTQSDGEKKDGEIKNVKAETNQYGPMKTFRGKQHWKEAKCQRKANGRQI